MRPQGAGIKAWPVATTQIPYCNDRQSVIKRARMLTVTHGSGLLTAVCYQPGPKSVLSLGGVA